MEKSFEACVADGICRIKFWIMNVSDKGVFIDNADFEQIEKEVRPGGQLYRAIKKARTLRDSSENSLPSGRTVKQFNAQDNTILLQEITKAFDKGVSFPYHDERSEAEGTSFFISANPDGSEDLQRMDIVDNIRIMTTIREVTPKGKGKYFLQLYGR